MDDEDYQVDPDYEDFTDEEMEYPEEIEYPKDLELIAKKHTPVTIEVDTTLQFQTDTEFKNRDIVVEFARKCGRKHGVVVVVKRSDINDRKRTPRVMLGCERAGRYRGKENAKNRRSSTKRCGCPFSMKAYVSNAVPQKWRLIVLNGKHNHTLVQYFEGHSFVGRLNREERDTVERLCNTGVRSRDILNHLKLKDPKNATVMKTIYNVRTTMRIKETAGKSHMQQLFNLLIKNEYVVRH